MAPQKISFPTTRPERLEDLLGPTLELARQFLAREEALPSQELRSAAHLQDHLDLELGEEGQPVAAVLAQVDRALQATPSSSSLRFLNQLFGGRVPIATAAEMLTTLPNTSMYTFKAAGAQILIENEVLRKMRECAGFPEGEGCFTPGGSMANLVAMLLARSHAVPEFRDRGASPERLIVYTSAEGHYSVPKAAGILGLGRANVRTIPVDGKGRMDVAALALRIAEDRSHGCRPLMINATAGTTVRGAFDPIREISGLAREQRLWLHVDGALGGSLLLSRAHRQLLDGLELADSLAWNPHKLMGVPLQSSVLLVARRGTLARNLDETADYLFQADEEALNPGHRSIQCGRRNDAFKLWAAWKHLGDQGWDARVDRQMALAAEAARLIQADPELKLLEQPSSINVCFEVLGRSSVEICNRLDREGIMKIGYGEVQGRRAIRLVCVNPELDSAALENILGEIKAMGSSLPLSQN